MSATAVFREFSLDTGVIAAGWKLYHYEPGTVNTKTAWLDRNKADTAAQPIVADANGVASGYFDGLYDLVVYDADDVLKYTWEDVYIADAQSLGTEGSPISSSGVVVLGSESQTYFHISGTANMTGLSGDQTFVVLTFDSTPLLSNGSDFVLYSGEDRFAQAGETIMFVNDGAGKWREISPKDMIPPSTWTPTLTFQTPGDLSVSYTTRQGLYTRNGRTGMVSFSILTSAFTHTTASGTLFISGIPASFLPDNNIAHFNGTLSFRGITKANFTQYTPYIADGLSNIQIMASGSGQTPANLATGDLPTGGTVQLYGTIMFMYEES
jgi:hypothetical protein